MPDFTDLWFSVCGSFMGIFFGRDLPEIIIAVVVCVNLPEIIDWINICLTLK